MARDTSLIEWSNWFIYDTSSPSFLRWKVDKRGGKNYNVVVKHAGEIAGSFCRNNLRWDVGLNNALYKVHRVVWEMHYGAIPKSLVIDHIDHDASNNRIENLRVVSQQTNMRNIRLRKGSTSGVAGVSETSKTSRGKTYLYITCQWTEDKKYYRHFSIDKLGYECALLQAIACRNHQMELLKEKGYGYTDRHGK